MFLKRKSEAVVEDTNVEKKIKKHEYGEDPKEIICEECSNVVELFRQDGNIPPCIQLGYCALCNDKTVHKTYYNICFICAGIQHLCVVCCSANNHVAPMNDALSPILRKVITIFPMSQKRYLIQYAFNQWRLYVTNEQFTIHQFKDSFLSTAYGFLRETEEHYMSNRVITDPCTSKSLPLQHESDWNSSCSNSSNYNDCECKSPKKKHCSSLPCECCDKTEDNNNATFNENSDNSVTSMEAEYSSLDKRILGFYLNDPAINDNLPYGYMNEELPSDITENEIETSIAEPGSDFENPDQDNMFVYPNVQETAAVDENIDLLNNNENVTMNIEEMINNFKKDVSN